MNGLYLIVLVGATLWAGWILYHELLPPPLDPPTEPYIPIRGGAMRECRHCDLPIEQNEQGQWYDMQGAWRADMPDSVYVCLGEGVPGTHEPKDTV